MQARLSCVDFPGLAVHGCCGSCHDDVDEGYYSGMCSPTYPGRLDVDVDVCCAVNTALDCLGYDRKREFYVKALRSFRKRTK